MSYQVFARKLRPAGFDALVGQDHVVRALVHALENDRVHHAYLFTGTRGVGKTTIARILAKCLNCETGVTATPCGVCSACREISEGRFVDLIEVDAASRTKVDDTRDLLDNAQYLPARGRYKVYLIDEVHMLSSHSFNALLKTLEEPPPHVKFMLATTDPKKVPITVLSRCLQFQLKNLLPERISTYLGDVLTNESIDFDQPALGGDRACGARQHARRAEPHRSGRFVWRRPCARARRARNAGQHRPRRHRAAAACVARRTRRKRYLRTARRSRNRRSISARCLSALLSALHEVAVVQAVGAQRGRRNGDRRRASRSDDAGTVQLFYQIVLVGLRDLAMAPDPRCGFEMVMLRLLAFEPLERAARRCAPVERHSEKRLTAAMGRARKRAVDLPRSRSRTAGVGSARAGARRRLVRHGACTGTRRRCAR